MIANANLIPRKFLIRWNIDMRQRRVGVFFAWVIGFGYGWAVLATGPHMEGLEFVLIRKLLAINL